MCQTRTGTQVRVPPLSCGHDDRVVVKKHVRPQRSHFRGVDHSETPAPNRIEPRSILAPGARQTTLAPARSCQLFPVPRSIAYRGRGTRKRSKTGDCPGPTRMWGLPAKPAEIEQRQARPIFPVQHWPHMNGARAWRNDEYSWCYNFGVGCCCLAR